MYNAKAIAEYRKRRIQRLRARFDADDDDTNNAPPSGGGGHGNTKLPFGLCQREGIKIDPNWTPKDAWNALEGKGYSAKETYQELRTTGKVAPKTPKAPTKTPAELKKMGKTVSDLKKNMKKRDKLEKDLAKVSGELLRETQEKERLERGARRMNEKAEEILSRYGSEDRISREKASDDRWASSPYDDYQSYRRTANSYKKDAQDAEKRIAEIEQKKSDVESKLSSHSSREEYKQKYDQAVDELLSHSPLTTRVNSYRAAEESGKSDRIKLADIDKNIESLKHSERVYQRVVDETRKGAEERGEGSGAAMTIRLCEGSLQKIRSQIAEYEEKRKPIADRLAERENKMATAKGDADDKSWKEIYDLSVERDTVEDGPYDKLSRFVKGIRENKIAFNAPRKFAKQPSEEEIISNISGGDKTSGSCVSLACAYMANKAGYDVLDFRGSSSRKFFAYNWKGISRAMGAMEEIGHNDVEATNKLLQNVEEGKEYWLSTGRHAAMVRKRDGKLEFLELQSWKQNGWKELNDERLVNRFKCKTRRRETATNTLVESSLITGSPEFMSMMGYINTALDKQQKGAEGGEK